MAYEVGEERRWEWAYRIALVLGSLALAIAALGQVGASASGRSGLVESVRATPRHATGTFEVKMLPQPEPGKDAPARMSLEKQFHGDLEGTSKVEMLTAMTAVKGSAGYVAIEHVTGTLGGHAGSFVLQHSGSMTRGVQQLLVTVVPDSGTDGMVGLAGAMTIQVVAGKHSYTLDYTLGDPP